MRVFTAREQVESLSPWRKFSVVDPTQETIQAHPDYVYHATHDFNAQGVKDDGYLDVHDPWHGTDQDSWPDGSIEPRSYWTQDPQTARNFYPEGGHPVLLRSPRSNTTSFRRENTGDFYSSQPISSDDIEAYSGNGIWTPLKSW